MCQHIFMCGDIMGNMTLSVPDDLQAEMRQFSEVKWSEVARKAFASRVETLKLADKLASKSRLTEKDVEEFSKKIKKSATKRALDEYNRGH